MFAGFNFLFCLLLYSPAAVLRQRGLLAVGSATGQAIAASKASRLSSRPAGLLPCSPGPWHEGFQGGMTGQPALEALDQGCKSKTAGHQDGRTAGRQDGRPAFGALLLSTPSRPCGLVQAVKLRSADMQSRKFNHVHAGVARIWGGGNLQTGLRELCKGICRFLIEPERYHRSEIYSNFELNSRLIATSPCIPLAR